MGNWGKEETGTVLRGGDHHVDGFAFLVTILNLGNVKFGLGEPDFIGP